MQNEPQKRGLKAKIIRFTTFPDGQDKDCVAITDDGREVLVDPFVGCSWDYDKREQLLNEWFVDDGAWQHEANGVWLTGEHSFKLLDNSEARADERNKVIEEVEEWIEYNEYSRPDTIEGFAGIVDTDDLLAKLNQLKEGK